MNIKGLFSGIDVSSAGLSAQRRRMDAISENIANAETTRTEEGGPYKRKVVQIKENLQKVFSSALKSADMRLTSSDSRHISATDSSANRLSGSVSTIKTNETEDESIHKMIYEPGHPDADEKGYVKMPNVNIVTEMVDMISATRAYEANVAVINAEKSIARDSLDI